MDSTLRFVGWLLSNHNYKGVVYPFFVTRENLEAMADFHVRDDDIVIVSYPKTGTNWTLEIVSQVLQAAGKSNATAEDHAFAKLEFSHPQLPRPSHLMLADSASPRVILTHLHPDVAPPGITNPKGNVKVLVVMRNPKDAAVSNYHFSMGLLRTFPYFCGRIASYLFSWSIFCNLFLTKLCVYGYYLDHLLAWWQKRDDPHFLFLKYEDMKKNLPNAVKKVAEFLEMDLDDAIIERIAENSSFFNMKRGFQDSQYTERRFMARKGVVGDWKNYFSPAQSEAYDVAYREMLGGTGLEFEFE